MFYIFIHIISLALINRKKTETLITFLNKYYNTNKPHEIVATVQWKYIIRSNYLCTKYIVEDKTIQESPDVSNMQQQQPVMVKKYTVQNENQKKEAQH